MAIDTRDWYRDKLRKRTGYVERATFRTGRSESLWPIKFKAWRRKAAVAAVIVLAITALALLR